jgi:hypothetical protein
MKEQRPAISSVALAGVLGVCLCFCLLLPASSPGAPLQPISGKLDRRGIVVVALAPHGRVVTARARPGFRLVPPAPVVTLQLRGRRGAYLGPVVVGGSRGRVTLGVRAGAKIGRIAVHDAYARAARKLPRRAVDARVTARARRGIPLGAGALGWVRGRAHGPRGPGHDSDRDGIPNKFDVDDDGDLVLDFREHRAAPGRTLARAPAALTLGVCPAAVCSGSISSDLSDADRADVALIVAIAAAVLAAASLAMQLLTRRRSRKRRVEVDVRLGLPIYQQGGGDWAVFIEVLNHTDHPVRWVSAALELADGRRLYLMQQPPGGELPAVLQPHDSHQTWAPCRELERAGFDLAQHVVGIAKLDSGETLRSPSRRLVSKAAARRG